MALYHFSVGQIKRSAGQSAIAAAAYRAGENLYSTYYGEHSDYTRKGGVIYSEIMLPPHAPAEFGIALRFGTRSNTQRNTSAPSLPTASILLCKMNFRWMRISRWPERLCKNILW